MTGKASELASAAVLADSAFEMLVDAATILTDAGDHEGQTDLYEVAEQVSKAVERLNQRKAALEAPPANENEPKV